MIIHIRLVNVNYLSTTRVELFGGRPGMTCGSRPGSMLATQPSASLSSTEAYRFTFLHSGSDGGSLLGPEPEWGALR